MLTNVGVQHDSDTAVAEARVLLGKWKNENVNPEIVKTAAENGYQVLFTPQIIVNCN